MKFMIIVRFLADLIENTVMKETICLTEEERRQFRADFFFSTTSFTYAVQLYL